MVCSILLDTACQAISISLEYKNSGLHYHFGNIAFWQLKRKKRNIVAVFTAAYMPVSKYLVICKKPVALDNWCEYKNNNIGQRKCINIRNNGNKWKLQKYVLQTI